MLFLSDNSFVQKEVKQMNKYGYVRVSTLNQKEDRQLTALNEIGIKKENIYLDKISGKDFQRNNYKRLLKRLKKGDELYIISIDRLGRNYQQILEQWRIITKEKEANIIVLDMPILDTRNSKDLSGTLIADIVLQLLSYVAQIEREFIKQRQKEGIDIAKQNGIKFGRKPIKKPDNFNIIINEYYEKRINCRQAAQQLNVSHKTFLKWVKEEKLVLTNGGGCTI